MEGSVYISLALQLLDETHNSSISHKVKVSSFSFQSRIRLAAKKGELEEILNDYSLRLEEEEEKISAMMEERKKFNQNIADLEDQYVFY